MYKRTADILFYIFFTVAVLLALWRWYLTSNGDHETAAIVRYVILGLVIGAFIFRIGQRLFPRWFKERPTREELDEK